GNHENYDMINSYPVETFFGGKVHKITDNIYHLMRGEMFEIEGKKIFVMGGARSHDISDGILDSSDKDLKMKEKALIKRKKLYYRVKGVSWWEEEMPCEEEFAHAFETLEKNNHACDYVITHDCPADVQKILVDRYIDEKKREQYSCDRLNGFLQEVSEKCSFKKWYFGHYHSDIEISERYRLLYEDVVELGD
ncbi:MAG: metallophosphatase, partial [Clostridia bacterium]|nr:metallophosphatase [Clostridia bacterium]